MYYLFVLELLSKTVTPFDVFPQLSVRQFDVTEFNKLSLFLSLDVSLVMTLLSSTQRLFLASTSLKSCKYYTHTNTQTIQVFAERIERAVYPAVCFVELLSAVVYK